MKAKVTVQDVRTSISKFKNVVSFEHVQKCLLEVLEYIEFSYATADKLQEAVDKLRKENEKLERDVKKNEKEFRLAEMELRNLQSAVRALQSRSR